MVGTQVDDRRWYGKFDKERILKRTGGICACCGKKLNLKTMTVEHVIPILRGGYDSERNTVALCKDCNDMKGNMLYIPRWFYSAIADKPLSMELTEMFAEWFQKVKGDFDIEVYPLVAPKHNLLLSFAYNSRAYFARSNIIQWHYTGKQYMDEVGAITGVDLKGLRDDVSSLMPARSGKNAPVALYTCRKLTTDKILSLAAVSFNLEEKMAVICMEWSELPKGYRAGIYFSIIRLLNDVLTITKYGIEELLFLAPVTDMPVIEEMQMYHIQNLRIQAGSKCQSRAITMMDSTSQKEYAGLQIRIYDKDRIPSVFSKFNIG